MPSAGSRLHGWARLTVARFSLARAESHFSDKEFRTALETILWRYDGVLEPVPVAPPPLPAPPSLVLLAGEYAPADP